MIANAFEKFVAFSQLALIDGAIHALTSLTVPFGLLVNWDQPPTHLLAHPTPPPP